MTALRVPFSSSFAMGSKSLIFNTRARRSIADGARSMASMVDLEKSRRGGDPVWKFGYGSNMSQDYLRDKKGLSPLDYKRTVLSGFRLSFPKGWGIDFVEPAFATLKRDPSSTVHGISTLLSQADAIKLDEQESAYAIEVHPATVYGKDGETVASEVYVSKTPLPLDHEEGACSDRYRAVLVKGAKECDLDPSWISHLSNLPVYEPTADTIAKRSLLPPPSSLPQMTIEELSKHNGDDETKPVYVSAMGYVFDVDPIFKVMRGRDVTFRNISHYRGKNLELVDDGGKSPFPKLSALESGELEYALRYRDRFHHKSKSGKPVAVLEEFWQEQERDLPVELGGENSLSLL